MERIRKGWLPLSYGKKSYKEMNPEEQAVIDKFEGEAEYGKVFTNSDYYLFNMNNVNLLESLEDQDGERN